MRSLKLGLVATAALICAFSVSAQAGGNCVRIGALGDGLTHDLAVIMSTHGLTNIIEGKGLRVYPGMIDSVTDGVQVTARSLSITDRRHRACSAR